MCIKIKRERASERERERERKQKQRLESTAAKEPEHPPKSPASDDDCGGPEEAGSC